MARFNDRNFPKREDLFSLRVGRELIMGSETATGIIQAHNNLQTGLSLLGFGLVGLLAVRQFTK